MAVSKPAVRAQESTVALIEASLAQFRQALDAEQSGRAGEDGRQEA